MNTNLTEHFTEQELGVTGCDQRFINNARFLCQLVLEPIRAQFGPVHVHDGYRSSAENLAAGGKVADPHTGQQDSYHLFEGNRSAADIDCLPATSYQVLFDWIRLWSGLPFDKVIMEHDAHGVQKCVHLQVDTLATPRRLAYTGSTGVGTVYVSVPVS